MAIHVMPVVDDHLIRLNELGDPTNAFLPDFTADRTDITADSTTRTADET